jgi:hypothetical protein
VAARRLAVLVALAVATGVGSACSPGATPTRSAASAVDEAPVLVTSGVRYAPAPEGWADPTFDLYLPGDVDEPPLVVVVPDPDASPGMYEELARAIAQRGVGSAVVRWGVSDPALGSLTGRPLDDVVAQAAQANAQVGCAVAVAAAQTGPGVGSHPQPLLVLGHGAGANSAGMVSLTPTGPFPGCFAPAEAPRVAAAVLWGGDWLGTAAGDPLGDGVARWLEVYSPWPTLPSADASTFVEVGINANRLEGQAVEVDPSSAYLTDRDPTGAIVADLEEVSAFEDGAVDPVDVTRAFAVALGDAGVGVREREVHGEGDPDTLGPHVRRRLVDSVVQLARP